MDKRFSKINNQYLFFNNNNNKYLYRIKYLLLVIIQINETTSVA